MSTKTQAMSTLRQKRNAIRVEMLPIIKKNKAKNYKYAKLDEVVEHLSPHLKKYGVGYEHELYITDGKNCLKTTIYNIDDESDIAISTSIVSAESKIMSTHQATGAGITFFKRYHLVAMFGLLTENDTDGNTTSIPKSNKELDWIAIFTPYIKKGDKNDCLKKYEMHKSKMNADQKDLIIKMIDNIKEK